MKELKHITLKHKTFKGNSQMETAMFYIHNYICNATNILYYQVCFF